MEKTNRAKKIKCPIFQAKNETIEKLTQLINEAKDIKQKSKLAERLMGEAKTFLSCEYFNKEIVDCKICRYLAKLRIKTANLIIRARQLKADAEDLILQQ